jgi:hypothetical protein
MLDINIPEVVAEVIAAFNKYKRALIGDDVAVLDQLFWRNENLYGHDAIAAFRRGCPPISLAHIARHCDRHLWP